MLAWKAASRSRRRKPEGRHRISTTNGIDSGRGSASAKRHHHDAAVTDVLDERAGSALSHSTAGIEVSATKFDCKSRLCATSPSVAGVRLLPYTESKSLAAGQLSSVVQFETPQRTALYRWLRSAHEPADMAGIFDQPSSAEVAELADAPA